MGDPKKGECLCGSRNQYGPAHCGSCSCCRPAERGASKAVKKAVNETVDKHRGDRNRKGGR